MKPRAWRITLGAAVLVVAIVAVLVVTHWTTVRDHVEAWHFQLTRETGVFEPLLGFKGKSFTEPGRVIQELADYSGCEVVFDARYRQWFEAPPSEPVRPVKRIDGAKRDANYIAEIEAWGWRVLEQRFPRRAYVVILDEKGIVIRLQYQDQYVYPYPDQQ